MNSVNDARCSEAEIKVLGVLAGYYYSEVEWHALSFRSISRHLGIEPSLVRRLCRSLASKGFARFERGLFSDDGMTAGVGYRCTDTGLAIVPGAAA